MTDDNLMMHADTAPDREFQEIHEAFNEKIRRHLARIAGETEAEDLAQEVFVKVSHGLKNFRGESSLSTWIYKIATNAALDRLRVLSARKEAPDLPCEGDEGGDDPAFVAIDDRPSPEVSLIRKEMSDCIRGIVEGMQENDRDVLLLSDFKELPNSEIAGILGIPLDTVKIRLHRARARLRKELEAKCDLYRDERNELACDRASSPLKFAGR